tara:strand:+ start:30 stop:959 length:930 start_codon:yes stop_codon:yes gene_type:complete
MSKIEVDEIVNQTGDNDSGIDLSTNDKVAVQIAGTEVATIDTTGVVFNDGSTDRDFRVEGNGNANMLKVDAGLDAVLIGTSSEYTGTGADLTVNKAMDVGDSSSSDTAVIAFAKSATTGTIGSLQSKISGFGNMPKINMTATNVGGGSQEGDLEFYTSINGNNTMRFQIKGNADMLADDTNIGSLSDERLKKDIEDFTYDLDKFKAFQTKSFKWKNTLVRKTGTQYGCIAQQVESIDPDFIIEDELKPTIIIKDEETTNPDYTLAKDTDGVAKASKMTGKKDAMFISVIQQLMAKIETLEAKVTALESK